MTAGSKQVAQTKINNLDVTSLADEDVLDLEVPVHDAIPMQVVEGTCNLTAKLSGLLLLKLAVGDDVVEHLAAVDVFEKHIPMMIGTDNIMKRTNVWVIQEGTDSRFTSSSYFFGLVGALLVGTRLVAIIR